MDLPAFLYLLCANVLGGASYAATARALSSVSAAHVVFWRLLLGGVCLSPALLRLRGKRISRRAWAKTAAVGFFGLAAPLLIGTVGQKYSSATNASLLVGFEPVSIVLLCALFFGERLTWIKTAAIGAGLLGSSMIVLQGVPLIGVSITPHFRGDLLLFLHGFFWSLYSVLGKGALEEIEPSAFTAATTLFALLPACAAFFWQGPSLPPRRSWGAIVFLTLGVTWLATWCWNQGLERAKASQVANFVFLQPLVGVALGVFLQGERLTAWSAAGGGLILLGVYAATRRKEDGDGDQGVRIREVLDVPQGAQVP